MAAHWTVPDHFYATSLNSSAIVFAFVLARAFHEIDINYYSAHAPLALDSRASTQLVSSQFLRATGHMHCIAHALYGRTGSCN